MANAFNQEITMQQTIKREDGDHDRFVEYLKATEGVVYTTIAMDVKTRSGNKDFDYLLKSSCGELLALEVTRLPDLPAEMIRIKLEVELVEAVESHIQPENLHGRFLIQSPAYFFASSSKLRGILKNRSALLAEQIIREANTLRDRQSGSAETEVGPFGLKRLGEGHDFMLYGGFAHRWHPYHLHYFSEVIGRLIPKKNQQLDYEADRNVLLIRNRCYMARVIEIAQAITEFVSASAADLSNIDEIYVEYETGKLERLYVAI
jgi:hypothetical protein